ncbi:unnamed protein product [Trichobilharzia regenti]|nr:unnamed protein product [Trichobilharzia regenti]
MIISNINLCQLIKSLLVNRNCYGDVIHYLRMHQM